jgi:hypothetical protein
VPRSASPYDRAQLAAPLALHESEFCWYIFEGRGAGAAGPRRIAGLISIHRTGPRARRIAPGPTLIAGRDLPSPLRELVPGWLPLVSPLRVDLDDRPLFMVALYDLDDPGARPLQIEHELEHAELELDSFSARSRAGDLQLHRSGADGSTSIVARTERFELQLHARSCKSGVVFGDNRTPSIRHGRIATSYFQRPRLDVIGSLRIEGESIADFAGDGVHDHQWLRATTPNLKWIWPHLRLPDGRELTGYVIRDSSGGRSAAANEGRELGRAGWLIERDSTLRALARFDVRAESHIDTERGRVPTRFVVDAPEFGLRLVLDHVIPAPYLRMRAFGDAIDAGIYEGPVNVHDHPEIRGWVEVMNAATVRLTAAADPRWSDRGPARCTSR